jgi:carbonic anhydrase
MCDRHDFAHRLSRRGLVFAAAGVLAVAPNAISPDDALTRLVDGNARYAANVSINKDFSAGRAARALAQYPLAAILSCSDSRVAPDLEYGAQLLGTPVILVLGHTLGHTGFLWVIEEGTLLQYRKGTIAREGQLTDCTHTEE